MRNVKLTKYGIIQDEHAEDLITGYLEDKMGDGILRIHNHDPEVQQLKDECRRLEARIVELTPIVEVEEDGGVASGPVDDGG